MSIEQKAERVRIEKLAEDLWRREGGHCVSHLVATLAYGTPFDSKSDLWELVDQARELCTPIDDWEEAALQELEEYTDEFGVRCWLDKDGNTFAGTAQDACEFFDIEPYQREVFEHWIVSDWLADKLAEKGEKVDKDFAGLTIWARTTTGQAVYADSVMENIAAELHAWREV